MYPIVQRALLSLVAAIVLAPLTLALETSGVQQAYITDAADEPPLASQKTVYRAPFLSDEIAGCGEAIEAGCDGVCTDFCGAGCYEDACYDDSCAGAIGLEACQPYRSDFFAEVHFLWLRAHVLESAIGKLSEQYEFSPRLVLGFEDPCGIGGRLRYWHYGHQTPLLGQGGGIRFQFDVYDIEATSRIQWRKTDLVLSAGFRWADLEVEYDGAHNFNDMPGLTFGAEFRTELCDYCGRGWSAVYGGRLSALGGDWEGSNSGFIPRVRDDNVIVQELYGGVEYSCQLAGYELYSRLTLEIQNWHSDAAAQSAGADSIGLFGPGFQFGARF